MNPVDPSGEQVYGDGWGRMQGGGECKIYPGWKVGLSYTEISDPFKFLETIGENWGDWRGSMKILGVSTTSFRIFESIISTCMRSY